MKVILFSDVKKVGQKDMIVEVADGYARNVLIPKKLATPALGGALRHVEHAVASKAGKQATNEAFARTMMAKLDGQTVSMRTKASETGTLFVAIHERDIAAALEKDLGYAVPADAIHLEAPIKKTGDHMVPLSLSGAKATFTLHVEEAS